MQIEGETQKMSLKYRLASMLKGGRASVRRRQRLSVVRLSAGLFAFAGVCFYAGWVVAGIDQSLEEATSRESVYSQLDKLSGAISQVTNFENQLRLRASLLTELIAETTELDVEKLDEAVEAADLDIGVGGDDDEFAEDSLFLSDRTYDIDTSEGRRLLAALDFHLEGLHHIPMGAPVEGRVTSEYGMRLNPITKRRGLHQGLDIGVARRVPVAVTADGLVIRAGWKGAYGNTILVDHGGGIETLYGHLSEINVKPGEKVCRGEKIGFVGSTGRSTGPHLHYEVRVGGAPKNPAQFVELATFLRIFG